MRKNIFKLFMFSLLTATVFLLVGCTRGKDFTSFTKEYEQTLTAINLSLDISDIDVKKTDGDKITLHYYDTEKNFYGIKEEDGVLTVSRSTDGELKENIRFGLGMKKYYKVSLSVPNGYEGEITLQTVSGDISVKDISAENQNVTVKSESGNVKAEDISVSTLSIDGKSSEIVIKNINAEKVDVTTVAGEVITSNIECASYAVRGEAAEVDLKNVSIGQASITLTSGDVDIDNAKIGSSVYISVTSGDIEADGLDASFCTATSKSGNIYLDNLWIGGGVYLISDSGDIEARISDSVSGFTIDSVSDYGKNNLEGIKGLGGFKNLTVRNVTGDIDVRFVS